MPSLFRFLTVVAVIGGVVYGRFSRWRISSTRSRGK